MLPSKNKCCGCGSCAEECRKKCIRMIEDSEGFLYPSINKNECISCGLCEKVCPVLNQPSKYEKAIALAVKNKDDEIRKTSSSGGVFYGLAEYILSRNGLVCGAGFAEDFSVKHYLINSINDIPLLQGAKYSQSYAGDLFSEIKESLDSDLIVLFIGTPCQVAALKSYLKKDYTNLITSDIICHGVPSPSVWLKYLLERRDLDACGGKIHHINQRNKETGWSRYSYSVEIEYENHSKYHKRQHKDTFMRGFANNLYLRPSCSNCSFKGIARCSDLTLGDCWGIWDIDQEFDDNRGVSLLLIHSPNGESIWTTIKSNFNYREVDIDELVKNNSSLLYSSVPHQERKNFFLKLKPANSLEQLINELLEPKSKKENLIRRIFKKFM